MTAGRGALGDPERGGWLWRPLLGAAASQVVLGIARPAASYAGLELGADAALIGVIAASFAVIPMAAALPVGALAGRLRHIGVVPLLSGLLLIVGCVLGAVADAVPLLIIACALIGVANLGVLLGAQAWISRSAPAARYNDGFGWMTAGMALGQAVGPLAAGVLVGPTAPTSSGIAQAFCVSAAAAVPIVGVFASRATRSYSPAVSSGRVGAVAILRTEGVGRYIVISAAVLTSVDILTAYLPVLGAEHGIAPVLIGAMLAVRGVASMLSRLLLGPLGRRFGQSRLMVASAIGAAAALLIMALAPVPWVMFAALALGGFLLGMGQPLTMTAVAVALPERARSRGLALRLLGNRIAQTATPLVAGAVTVIFGVASVFLVQVVGLVLSGAWEALAAGQDDERDGGDQRDGDADRRPG